jgi:preprotein translocase subunit SecG
MDAVITILHVLVCVFLVAVVLLQRGKGAQVGAVFGGGAGATMFGSRGAGNFLTKLTTGAAIVYMLTSLSLSYLGITGAGERLFEDGVVEQEQAAEPSLFEELGTVPAETDAAAAEPGDAPDAGAAAAEPAAGDDAEAAPEPPQG